MFVANCCVPADKEHGNNEKTSHLRDVAVTGWNTIKTTV